MSRPNVKRAPRFLTILFTNNHDQPIEPAKSKEDGRVSDNFFVNDHSKEPSKCKEDGPVSDFCDPDHLCELVFPKQYRLKESEKNRG